MRGGRRVHLSVLRAPTAQSGRLTFVNQRALWWWRLREALDPSSGEDLAIPPDRELLADLCSPKWKLMTRGIQVEPKEAIVKRIGRSPDKGESLVYARGDPGNAGMANYLANLSKPVQRKGTKMQTTSKSVSAPAPVMVKLKTTPGRAFYMGGATPVRYTRRPHRSVGGARRRSHGARLSPCHEVGDKKCYHST